jgi:hypothetical protein
MFKKFNLPHIINMLYVTHQPISPANHHSSIIKIRPSALATTRTTNIKQQQDNQENFSSTPACG